MKKALTKFEKEFGLMTNEEGMIVVNSRTVAQKYGKEHKDVMKKIRGFIELIPELGERNFSPSSYLNGQNKQQLEYLMDRQGFSMLVNKFTGNEALKFTYKYTKAFEEMAEELEHMKEQTSAIEKILHSHNELSLKEFNKIRFSEKKTIKTFEYCEESKVRMLVDDFISYAEELDTQTRIIRCRSAIKGIQRLHDRLAYANVTNIGDCYILLQLSDRIKTVEHEAENRRNGQIKGHKGRKIKELKYKLQII